MNELYNSYSVYLKNLFGEKFRNVTIDAGLRWRNRCVSGFFDRRVTIPAIHFQLASMELVTKWNWLFRCVTDMSCLWRDARHEYDRAVRDRDRRADQQNLHQSVCPRWKSKVFHSCSPDYL